MARRIGTSPLAAARSLVPRLFLANNRATIHFVRHDEGDFGSGAGSSGQDLRFRDELVGRKPGIENDEVLSPQGIESLTLDSIDHGYEILFLVQVVRRVDLVDAPVPPDER